MNPSDLKKLLEVVEKLKDVVDPSVYPLLQAEAARYAQMSPEEIRAESEDMVEMLPRKEPALPASIDPAEFARIKDYMKAQIEPMMNRLREVMPDAFGELD